MELISNSTGNWDIYRTVNEESFDAFIIRFPKMNSKTIINSYIGKHVVIKDLGLPTLNTVERFELNSRTAIRTEDLNYRKDRIYVSPNSVYGKSRKLLDALNPYANSSHEKIWPEYEKFRYTNRLEKITNFEEFVTM